MTSQFLVVSSARQRILFATVGFGSRNYGVRSGRRAANVVWSRENVPQIDALSTNNSLHNLDCRGSARRVHCVCARDERIDPISHRPDNESGGLYRRCGSFLYSVDCFWTYCRHRVLGRCGVSSRSLCIRTSLDCWRRRGAHCLVDILFDGARCTVGVIRGL
jgi:hypothetical protein